MTKLEQLRDLQALLDKATEGNRDIDFMLAPFLGYVKERRERDKKEWWYLPDKEYHRHSCDYVSTMPRFSSSIDPALAWVKKMVAMHPLSLRYDERNVGNEWSFAWDILFGGVRLDTSYAPTAPLAILKAAVAARIEREADGSREKS